MKNTPLLALRQQYEAAVRRFDALPSKRRYFIAPVLIGAITGMLALLFVKLLNLFNRLFLEDLVGYYSPHAAGGFGASDMTYSAIPQHPWILPVCLGSAGLVSGLIAKYVARSASGLGTDVAISAYHHDPAALSLKDSFAKLITSALVLGAGGPSGWEGAMSLIGGAVGATVAKLLRQSHTEMREALAIGVGAGLGAMFKAPLAGAIISAELFYRHDFEIETILPAFVAGSIAYVIVAMKTGFSPLIATFYPGVERVPDQVPVVVFRFRAVFRAYCSGDARGAGCGPGLVSEEKIHPYLYQGHAGWYSGWTGWHGHAIRHW